MAEAPRLEALVRDMKLALLAELGARSLYGMLRRAIHDDELARVFRALHEDEERQVERLRAVLGTFGVNARTRSRRRELAAYALLLTGRLVGWRFVLRVCTEAESTVGRWYARYVQYLEHVGRPSQAAACAELGLTKRRHAQILETWVDLLPRR